MTKNENKTNDSKDLIEIIAETELDTLKDKDSRLIDEFLDCLDVKEAFRRVGYAESTINSGYPYQKFKKPKFQQKLQSAYIARDYKDLAVVYALEREGLHEVLKQRRENPESIIENLRKVKHITKQKKQIAGILSQNEAKPLAPTINIRELFVGPGYKTGLHPHSVLLPGFDEDVKDGEVIDE